MAKKKDIPVAKVALKNQPPSNDLLEKIGERKFTWLAIGVFALLTVIFFRQFIFSDQMFFGTDTIPSEYMKRTICADYVKAHGELPQWDPYMLGGLPFVDAMHGDIFYPTSVLQLIMPVHRALGWKLILHIFLAGVFMFFCLRQYGIRPYAAFLGGLLYMFTPNFVTFFYGGHDGKIFVIALFPLMFWCLRRALCSQRIFDFLLFGATVGLSLLTSHIQMTYFALWGLGFYFAYFVIDHYFTQKRPLDTFKLTAYFWAGILLGLGIGMVQFLPPYLYVQEFSVRAAKTGYEHAASWAMHPEELFSLMVPEFVGYLDTYWGRNVFRLNYTGVGIIVLVFMGVRFMIKRTREEWVLLAFALFFLFFAMGEHTPVHKLAYYLVPGVKLFRGPEMSLFLFGFFTIVLAAKGLDGILARQVVNPDKLARLLMIVLAAYAALVLIIVVAGAESFFKGWIGMFASELTPEKSQALQRNIQPFENGLWISLVMVGACLGMAYAYLKGKLGIVAITAVLALVIIIDLWRIDSTFVQTVNPRDYFSKDQAIAQLEKLKTKDRFRVYPLPGSYQPNYLGIFGLESVGGFHDNEIKWFRDFRNQEQNFVYKLQRNEVESNPFLNLLNVKYLLYREPKSKQVRVIPNAGALPRVFTVARYEVQPDANELLVRLRDDTFDYRNVVLLEADPGVTIDNAVDSLPVGTVKIDEYGDHKLAVTVTMRKPGFVVFSENYFPYWQATVNGKSAPILKTDYTLRSVYVPAGEHKVAMEYVSKPYRTGRMITWLSLLLFAGVVGGNIGYRKYWSKNSGPTHAV